MIQEIIDLHCRLSLHVSRYSSGGFSVGLTRSLNRPVTASIDMANPRNGDFRYVAVMRVQKVGLGLHQKWKPRGFVGKM